MKNNTKIKRGIFDFAVLIKLFLGVFDILLSFIFLKISSDKMVRIIETVAKSELAHDPNDLLVNFLVNIVHHVGTGTRLFLAIYFLIHGIINIFLFIAVWRRQTRMYPLVIVILSVLTTYQIVRFFHTYSLILLGITIIDIIIICFAIYEYKK